MVPSDRRFVSGDAAIANGNGDSFFPWFTKLRTFSFVSNFVD